MEAVSDAVYLYRHRLFGEQAIFQLFLTMVTEYFDIQLLIQLWLEHSSGVCLLISTQKSSVAFVHMVLSVALELQTYSSVGKECACNEGDPSLIPESGRSSGEGIGYPLQ